MGAIAFKPVARIQRHVFLAEATDVIAQDALHAPFAAVFQPHHGQALHALVQGQRQGTGTDQAALVFQRKPVVALRLQFDEGNGQTVFEIDGRRLRAGALAETGATMIGVSLQVQRVVELQQHVGLAAAGHAAHHHEGTLGQGLVDGFHQKMAQRLVAAGHARIGDAGFALQPLLGDLRAQAAAEAIQAAFRMRFCERRPGRNPFVLHRSADQLMTQFDGGLLALLLVAQANLMTLAVIHQRQVHRSRKGALAELHRRPRIQHGRIGEEQFAAGLQIGHQSTSTA